MKAHSPPGIASERGRGPIRAALFDGLVLGAVGFACGFFGPIALSPDANQGPLLGIFITGPAGAALGALLGFVGALLGLPRAVARGARIAAAIVLAGVTLYFSTPEPAYVTRILEAEIRACADPATKRQAAIAYWDKALARTTWAAPREGWREDLDRMLAEHRGVVLDVAAQRQTSIYENRKPWNRGTLVARPDRGDSERTEYFASYAGGSCERYPVGERATFAVTGQTSRAWPPEILANLLDLATVEPAQARLVGLAASRTSDP